MRFYRLTTPPLPPRNLSKEVIIFTMTTSPGTSPRKADANRRNASKSTGPRTPQGKAWSRLNALKHGVLAAQTVFSTIEGPEDRKLFETMVDGLEQDFQPVGTYEQLLVQEIAGCFWRKRRLLLFENRAAFDAKEVPAAHIVQNGLDSPIPWRDPLYTQGEHLTTAEQICKHAGLDAVSIPNEKDTLRVIRYEAAINRTRERAVASLREMRKARRGLSAPRQEVAPAVDRVAAGRNARSQQAKMLAPWFSLSVWTQFKENFVKSEISQLKEFRAELETLHREKEQKNQTKPKTFDQAEQERLIKKALDEVFAVPELKIAPATPPADPGADPKEPPPG
jgi:hypothetical protein